MGIAAMIHLDSLVCSHPSSLVERAILETSSDMRGVLVCDHTRQRYIGNRWVCADCGAGI
jgi:hypothetical protein